MSSLKIGTTPLLSKKNTNHLFDDGTYIDSTDSRLTTLPINSLSTSPKSYINPNNDINNSQAPYLPEIYSYADTTDINNYKNIPDTLIRDEDENLNPFIPYSINGHLKLPYDLHLEYEYYRNYEYYNAEYPTVEFVKHIDENKEQSTTPLTSTNDIMFGICSQDEYTGGEPNNMFPTVEQRRLIVLKHDRLLKDRYINGIKDGEYNNLLTNPSLKPLKSASNSSNLLTFNNNSPSLSSSHSDDSHTSKEEEHFLTYPLPLDDKKWFIFKQSLPMPFWMELITQIKLSSPLMCSYTISYAISLVNLAFQGHISDDALASSSVAILFMNITGHCVLDGLNSAIDTLGSQHYGRDNMFQVGMTILRSILVSAVIVTMISILWFFSAIPIAFLLHDNDHIIVDMAQEYIRVSIISLPGICLLDIFQRYLEIQQNTLPTFFINVVGLICAIPCNYILTDVLEMGFLGSAWSNNILQYCMLLATLIYLKCSHLSRHIPSIWNHDTILHLAHWDSLLQYLHFALPGVAGTASEWIAFEAQILIASFNGKLSVASQSLLLSICSVVVLPAMSIGIATSVRLGAFLGAKQTACALNALYVSIFLGLVIQGSLSLLLFIFRHQVVRLFTDQYDVEIIANYGVPYISLFCFLDGYHALFAAVMAGIGQQRAAFIINIVGYWLIALPLSWYLSVGISHHTYYEDGETITRVGLGIIGQWYAIILASVVVFVSFLLFLLLSDWSQFTKDIEEELRLDEEQQDSMLAILESFENQYKLTSSSSTPSQSSTEHIL